MRTLIYKRTHEDDPDPGTGVFGNKECMGRVRLWKFYAVIGVGGIGDEAKSNHIDGLLTWIGIGAHQDKDKVGTDGYPLVSFDHFLYFGKGGRPLEKVAPALARRMYGKNVRVLMDSLSPAELLEVEKILDLARHTPPSGQLKGVPQRNLQETSGKCRSSSC
jgi:hypothetical protein